MKRLLFLLVLAPALLFAKQDGAKQLASMLSEILSIEQVHPDSVCPYIERIEVALTKCNSEEEELVYTLALGRFYNERQRQAYFSGRTDYAERSYQCFATVFAHTDLLANMKAKRWVPVTDICNGDKYFNDDMLNVAWRTMLDNVSKSVRDTSTALPTLGEMIQFYRAKGNRDAVFVLKRDSLLAENLPEEESKRALLALCDEFTDANRNLIKDQLLQLSDPFINVDGPSLVYPNKRYQWRFAVRNVSALRYDGGECRFNSPSAYDTVTDSLWWEAPDTPGEHTVTFLPVLSVKSTEKVKPIEHKVFVTRLKLIYQWLPESRLQLLVVDSESGEPQEGVAISLYEEGNDVTPYAIYHTDAEGRDVVPSGRRNALRVRISTDTETEHTIQKIYRGGMWQDAAEDSSYKVSLYTDRAIYRPSQALHVGGVAYSQKGWNANVSAGRNVTLVLRDASSKEVERQTVKCDDMGIFSADFTLPANGRLGYWSIRTDVGNVVSFRVEEYKRPTFYVAFADTVELTTDSLTLTGKALRYDGEPMRNARITGTLTASHWFLRTMGEKTSLDTIYTDEMGVFSYRLKRDSLTTNLGVMIDVLSNYGEQQSASHWYRIAGKDYKPSTQEVDSAFVFTCLRDTFSVGEPAYLNIYSNLSDVCLYYTLSANGEIVTDTLMRFGRDSLQFTIPYDSRYGTGAVASFCFVKGGKVYTQRQNLYLRQPDSKLRVRWDTFRDKVHPGDKEEWQLTLLRPDGTPASANLMVTLYDASLDYLSPLSWELNVARTYRLYAAAYTENVAYRGAGRSYSNYYQKRPYLKGLMFTTLNDKYFSAHGVGGGVMMLTSTRVAANLADAASFDVAEEEDVAQMNDAQTQEETVTVPLREDFSESAIFLPSLRTNQQGEVSIVFTLPESLTTWHLLGVAHTADMLTAGLDEEIVASKDLMAQLRLPRFLRPGDEAQITATVTNTTSGVQSGDATLQLVDAETEKVINTYKVKVNLMATADTTYYFSYTAAEGDVIVRWRVEGKDCSDGEQRLLPVLPATMEVTNTIALFAPTAGSKSIDLAHIFPDDAADRKLTIEYTTHPEQYALQALPALCEAKGKDVLSIATAYYASSLAQALGVSVPDTATSYLQQLKALQLADGSFTWYPGMPGSAYLTREVGYLLSRLQKMVGDCGDESMYRKAASSLLADIPVPEQVSTYMLRNLYVIQNAGLSLSKEEKSKVDSLVVLVKKLKPEDTDVEGMALSAIVLKQCGETKKAKAMVDAFRKRLVTTDEAGTYIEFPQGPFSSIDRKLHIHVQLMEALQAVEPDAEELTGMRRHLLQKKRTQAWETPVTSANAVFALMYEQPAPAPQTASDELTLYYDADEVKNFVAPADSLGYVRDSVEVVGTARELRLQKFSEGESWGNVYADFRQSFSKVESASMGLSSESAYPAQLTSGQRVTAVYKLVADQDYDYVTLSVPHPAATEVAEQLSSYGSSDGLGYYREVKEDCTEYHFYHIPRGHYQIKEDFYVERSGEYHTGVPTIRCDYAPEYSGHSTDKVLSIK